MFDDLVSIVLATYNGEKYIRQQLDSLLRQTHKHIEIIVVDDGSSDSTLSIVKEYVEADSRIHLFSTKKNLGLVGNFERGIKIAKGDFIALSDQDDIFVEDKIELFLSALKNNPEYDLVTSDLILIDENGNEIADSMWQYQRLNPKQGRPFRELIYSNFTTGCSTMFTRRLLKLALPFPANCQVHDWWLAVVSACAKAGGIYVLNSPLTYYRQHHANVIGAKKHTMPGFKVFFDRLFIHSDKTFFEERMAYYLQQFDRISGYLACSFWTAQERRMMEHALNLYGNYLRDRDSTFLFRVKMFPQRLHYAYICGGYRSCVAAVMHTLTPFF